MIFMVLFECFLSDMFCITTKVVHKLLPLQLFMVTTNNINKKVDVYSFLVLLLGLPKLVIGLNAND